MKGAADIGKVRGIRFWYDKYGKFLPIYGNNIYSQRNREDGEDDLQIKNHKTCR